MRLFEVVIAGGVASAVTDYLITGAWLHKRFVYSEAWREPVKNWALLLIGPLPFIASAALALVIARLQIHSIKLAILLACAIWIFGPLPLILSNAVYMKLRAFFVASSAFAALVRLLIMALLAVILLR